MKIPTEPIGSIPRPMALVERIAKADRYTVPELDPRYTAEYIPLEQLGTTDDCGFSPFSDDTSTTRATAFSKIRARVEGTRLTEEILGKQ